ncbi:histidine kinase [Spirosoma taeanense]|uniref:Histidine kinase n=2 Tax=Spirosoma taeanense TaxID=2735870 RepID=A0A6M5YEL6_9BACT|nr:histidine kinase [Spirosoma taeanense]
MALHIHRRHPSYQRVIRRICLSSLLASINSLLVTVLVMWIYGQLGYPVAPTRWLLALAFVFLTVIIVTAVYEGIHAFEQWKRYFMESEQLKKAQLQSQLEALKQQVNPHFLFNSLNILDALIDDDPQQARQFLDEMSTVYRYLLRSNEQNLTSLSTELAFIESYYQMLRTRHGQSLHLVTRISPQYANHQIPPLTLQLLVENAVKHNIILPDQPLTIEIATDDQAQLTVRNNLQRKHTQVNSSGVGLSNILTKYRVLGQATPTFQEDDQQFVVTLPLVAA